MSNFHELCLRRQSCRDFAEKPVEHEKLAACVETAILAPSACNSQPWSFVVVETPALLAEVATYGQPNGMNGFLSKAKAFFVVVEEHATLMPKLRESLSPQYFAKSDIGGAAAHLCLAAEDQGLGTCFIGLFNHDKLHELLGISQDKHINSLIAVGYPANDKVRPKIRKTLAEVVKFI